MFRMKNYVDFTATPPRAFYQILKGLKTNEVSRRDLVHADHRLLRKSFARWRRQFSRLSERSKEKFLTSNRNIERHSEQFSIRCSQCSPIGSSRDHFHDRLGPIVTFRSFRLRFPGPEILRTKPLPACVWRMSFPAWEEC